MDKDDLLRRAHMRLLLEHKSYSLEIGQGIGRKKQYHEEWLFGERVCPVCDLLRDIDKELDSAIWEGIPQSLPNPRPPLAGCRL